MASAVRAAGLLATATLIGMTTMARVADAAPAVTLSRARPQASWSAGAPFPAGAAGCPAVVVACDTTLVGIVSPGVVTVELLAAGTADWDLYVTERGSAIAGSAMSGRSDELVVFSTYGRRTYEVHVAPAATSPGSAHRVTATLDAGAQPAGRRTGALALRERTAWMGATVLPSGLGFGCVLGAAYDCHPFTLAIADAGNLTVALEARDGSDWDLRITESGGRTVFSGRALTGAETATIATKPGRAYLVQVTAVAVLPNATFVARATLSPSPPRR